MARLRSVGCVISSLIKSIKALERLYHESCEIVAKCLNHHKHPVGLFGPWKFLALEAYSCNFRCLQCIGWEPLYLMIKLRGAGETLRGAANISLITRLFTSVLLARFFARALWITPNPTLDCWQDVATTQALARRWWIRPQVRNKRDISDFHLVAPHYIHFGN